MIPFNKPFVTGKEIDYISDAIKKGKTSGDGYYTKKCQEFFENKYGFKKVLLTTSCTDALEMSAILLDIQPGDEVIVPSFTFVSTANAFALRGANIIFADSYIDNPNINPQQIKELITSKTKAIVVVHYAGVACDMDTIMELANLHNIAVVEDAAQAIDSSYKGKPLGSIGAFGTFSFHETKNIVSGEGGMLVINDDKYVERAEIIREKGTNRSSFFRGEVDKYSWVDIGSSFLPSDIIAAYLYGQLEYIEDIQAKRKSIWENYYHRLSKIPSNTGIKLPKVETFSLNNAHMFYLVCENVEQRSELISFLKDNEIQSVFHYLSLHKSDCYINKHLGKELSNSDKFSDRLVRLPMYFELEEKQVADICDLIIEFSNRYN